MLGAHAIAASLVADAAARDRRCATTTAIDAITKWIATDLARR